MRPRYGCHHRTYVASGPGLLAQVLQGWLYGPHSIIVSLLCYFLEFADLMTAMTAETIDKLDQSNYYSDPSMALLQVLDLEQNLAFNVRFFMPFCLEPFFF